MPRGRPRVNGLTPRQIEVLQLLVEGLGYKEVGRRLGLTDRAISHHMDKVKARLDVSTTPQAVAVALRRGLIR